MRGNKPFSVAVSAWLVCVLSWTAQASLKTIENPQGGLIIYGQVQGQTTEADAMGYILRNFHTQYGSRPQVGKLFQVRGTQSVAAFFTLTRRTQGNGNAQVAGLIIVTKATTEHVEAAVCSDDAARLSTTLGPMLKTLFGVWHPLEAGRTADDGPTAPAARLRTVVLPDRSASVGVPDGWNLAPEGGGGTLTVTGPNGEMAALNYARSAKDTNNPMVRQYARQAQQGTLYYPYNVDLVRAFPDVWRRFRRMGGAPPAELQIAHAEQVPGPRGQRCAHAVGQVDAHDGKGGYEISTVLCMTPPANTGDYMIVFHHSAIPNALADKERATMAAVLASFQMNAAVVGQQANALAAPRLGEIDAIGRAAAANRATRLQTYEIQKSSAYQRWDDIDRRSAAFSNYQLDYSVVADTHNNAHGTLWNTDAAALMQNYPQRFEYVNVPDFWKGIDY